MRSLFVYRYMCVCCFHFAVGAVGVVIVRFHNRHTNTNTHTPAPSQQIQYAYGTLQYHWRCFSCFLCVIVSVYISVWTTTEHLVSARFVCNHCNYLHTDQNITTTVCSMCALSKIVACSFCWQTLTLSPFLRSRFNLTTSKNIFKICNKYLPATERKTHDPFVE